ncbi:MAG: hypothetical protein JXO22_07670 [Phycisphaerae bacterium]|nr:hypothetical protein [Phycisphaerae bacterium]
MTNEKADVHAQPARPGPLHPRLMLSFTLLPIVTTICCVGLALVMEFAWSLWGPNPWYVQPLFVLIAASPSILTLAAWMLIWRSTVPWTRARRARAVGITAGFAVVIGGLAAICFLFTAETWLLVLTCGGLLAAGIASILLARTWVGSLHTHAGLPCPSCGYDLRGQHKCRCPECGAEYVVGQLVRSGRCFDRQGLMIR